MAINAGLTKVLPVPHEPGESITVRVLGWAALQRCLDAQTAASFGVVKAMGADLFTALQTRSTTAVNGATATATATAASTYDRATLFRESIVGWTYGYTVTPENIENLDPVTADWLAEALQEMYAAPAGPKA